MVASTDKYYDDIDVKLLEITVKMVNKALKYACEKHYLSERDINTLSRIWFSAKMEMTMAGCTSMWLTSCG